MWSCLSFGEDFNLSTSRADNSVVMASEVLDTAEQPSSNFQGRKVFMASSDFFTVKLGVRPSNSFSIPPLPAAPKVECGQWLAKGQGLTLGPFSISGGLIYTTLSLETHDKAREPSLLNRMLKIAPDQVNISERLTPYWPDYLNISPEARRAYVQWLAGGRGDPLANIGYVFLFFYGLEHRVLVDVVNQPQASTDIADIAAEVERLLSIYGANTSFRGYAQDFLDYLSHSVIDTKAYLSPPQALSGVRYDLPMWLRIGLGQMAVDQHPMNAQWALAWALADPDITRRTPVSRCPALFSTLFTADFERVYPDGIVLGHNKTKLKHTYRPASATLSAPSLNFDDLPDVTATSGTRKKLQLIVDRCTGELEPYSRYLGRYPNNPESLEALVQLPISLWPSSIREELVALKARIRDDLEVMSFAELGTRFNSAGILSRDKLIALARAFESLHIGMEPDVQAGSRTPKPDDFIALFVTQPEDGAMRATSAYNVASLTLDLASAVAVADGNISEDEVTLLLNQIDAWHHLSAAQRKRLRAHLGIQLQQPPTLVSLKSKLDPLDLQAKRAIAHFLANLAQADGSVSPAEVKLLERIYKVLQLDPQSLYGDLHVITSSSSTSTYFGVPVSTAQPAALPETQGLVLDHERIAKLQRETAEVAALLAKVFADDQIDESASEQFIAEPEATIDTLLPGVEGDHLVFLRLLISRTEWSRAELEDTASDMEMMLDGALEHINDMAFEHCDMPVTEGEDPVEINAEILEKLAL